MTKTFDWPWQYNFPPFFTIQCNVDTKSKQMETWCALVLSYHQHHKVFKLHLSDISSSPLFYNKTINRKLSHAAVMQILEALKAKGNIEWEDKNKTSCLVFWKTPQQWADLIHAWVLQSGQINTVCTLHELTQGVNTTNEEFYGLEEWLLIRALKILQSKGFAELIGDDGVKFFS